MKCNNSFVFFALFSIVPLLSAQPIVVWNRLLTHPNPMVSELLHRALEVTTDEYGDFQLISSEIMEQGRVIRQMSNSPHIQIAVFAPNKEREENAIAIRVPVTGTLLSYRICLIREGHQSDFNSVNSLQTLINSPLKIGSHQDWPDAQIMQENGLTLWKGKKYELLFAQLEAGRFDCFSRGANEIMQEYHSHADKVLQIEQNLIIYYPLPFYYFVNKSNPELALRLTRGLTILKNNGEYEAMFKDKFDGTLKKLAMNNRKTIELRNPLLTIETEKQMLRDKAYFDKLIKISFL